MKHLVIRSEAEQRLIDVAKLAGGLLALGAFVIVLSELPSAGRYLRMLRM